MNQLQLTTKQLSGNAFLHPIQQGTHTLQQPNSRQSLQNTPHLMSDGVLVSHTQRLVRQERELLTQVLHHLHEIDRRKLFSSLGCKSLLEFGVKHLGYSEDQACRRIYAMRLIEQIPEVETRLEKGELNLSHVSVLSTYFNQEAKFLGAPLSTDKKREVINMIVGTSIRKVQQIIRAQSSNPACLSVDQIKVITDTHVEVRFSAPIEIIDQIEVLKGFLAHKHPNITLGELMNKLVELGINEWDPAKPVKTQKAGTQSTQTTKDKGSLIVPEDRNPDRSIESTPVKRNIGGNADRDLKSIPVKQNQDGIPMGVPSITTDSRSRYIPMQTRREVFARAHNRCEECTSTYALEIDHVMLMQKVANRMSQICDCCAVTAINDRRLNTSVLKR